MLLMMKSSFPILVVNCGNAPTIQNGNADSVARMSYGNSVRYNCNKGYDLFGPSSVSCQADGSYTQLPSCSGQINIF